jgi:triacylglycerol esterase/lipase EstA (alpha/beta hydrolase family)
MVGISTIQKKLIRQGSELLRAADASRVSPADFKGSPVALFIHGFTADSGFMHPLMTQFSESGFLSIAFNYACFDGIDVAAKSLGEILESLDDLSDAAISGNRLVVIGHSMGGLVARALISYEGGSRFVRKLITLGTPHDGTLTEQKFIEYLLAWSESVSGLAQGGYSAKSRSALQLIGRDEPQFLLEQLKQAINFNDTVEFYSISGGLPFLEFGKGSYVSRLANSWIQRKLGGLANDGLVAEISSDLSQNMFNSCAPGCEHIRNYSDYPKVNHTNLVNNYLVALQAIRFAKRSP